MLWEFALHACSNSQAGHRLTLVFELKPTEGHLRVRQHVSFHAGSLPDFCECCIPAALFRWFLRGGEETRGPDGHRNSPGFRVRPISGSTDDVSGVCICGLGAG